MMLYLSNEFTVPGIYNAVLALQALQAPFYEVLQHFGPIKVFASYTTVGTNIVAMPPLLAIPYSGCNVSIFLLMNNTLLVL